MIPIHLQLIFYKFVALIQLAYSSEKPLIFNPLTLQIYDFGTTSMTYEDGPYVAACPAKGKHEIDFVEAYSLDHKSLFVRHYSAKKDEFVHRIRCHDSIDFAAAYYTDPQTKQKYLKFGYEVYFALINYTAIKTTSTYSNFERGFIWISKATSQIMQSEWRVHNLTYSMHKKVGRPATECYDYKLFDELNKKWPLPYYSRDNQDKIFSSVELSENDCESKTYCMKKYTLVPPYQFQATFPIFTSCTNLTTVPVWSKTTAPLLDYLDKFLFAVSQVVERKLTIYAEVYDTLVLPTNDKKGPENKYMYLGDRKKKILPIPRLIFKLVVYQPYRCNTATTLCWFQVVIVIHNEPTVIHKLCQEDKCQQLGWESIQYQDKDDPQKKSEHIYCCEMNANLRQILMGSTENEIKTEDLDLKNFPRFNSETHEYEHENKRDLIEDKMNKLFGNDRSFDPESWWFPLPLYRQTDYVDV